MKKILLTLILLLTVSMASVKIDLTGQAQQHKIVNGDAYYEVLMKASIRLREFIPIVYKDDLLTQLVYGMYGGFGVSQTYFAPRSNIYGLDHDTTRLDFSIGAIFGNIEIIYTHSARHAYAGSPSPGFFFGKDVDSIKFRYKTTFEVN